ncbi:MAG TPA: hypothetical protein VMF66_18870 [Candidatus Acidoferrum sp.]|nr:hypothetical protein [Candidatus Acidoferrum sp.]
MAKDRTIVTLLLLAPFIAELLSGATRLSVIYVLIPEVMTWGCGALIIRELVRRWQGARVSLLLLAPTLAIAEEIIIQQTSLAPLVFAGSNPTYGRAFGVNWIWLLAMLVFESFAVVLLPLQLTELAFRDRRNAPWLRARGFIIAGAVFLLGAFLAWFAWTQNYCIKILHLAPYHPPVLYIAAGLAAILLLGLASYGSRGVALSPDRATSKPAPPLIVGIVAALVVYPWQFVIALNFNLLPHLPFWIALLVGVAYTGTVFLILRRLSAAAGWSDLHRFAVCGGATVAVMVWGVTTLWHGRRLDQLGEAIFIAVGFAFLADLGRGLLARGKSQQAEQKTYA